MKLNKRGKKDYKFFLNELRKIKINKNLEIKIENYIIKNIEKYFSKKPIHNFIIAQLSQFIGSLKNFKKYLL